MRSSKAAASARMEDLFPARCRCQAARARQAVSDGESTGTTSTGATCSVLNANDEDFFPSTSWVPEILTVGRPDVILMTDGI